MIFAVYLVAALFILILIGAPIFISMGVTTLLHFYESGRLGAMIVLNQRLFDGLGSFPFLAVPMFLFAGEVMTRGGLTDRLIGLAQAFIGHLRGGLAQVNILSSVFFGGISGSAFADVAAIGSVLIPGMKREGYSPGFSGAVTAASSTLSPMIPPSIVLVIYGATFNVSIGALFAAGLAVAAFLAIAYMIVTYIIVRLGPEIPRHAKPNTVQLLGALKRALPALLLPIIIMGGIFSGRFTATESAAVAAIYALFLCMVVYRTIRIRDLPKLFETAAITSSAIALLVGVSIAFSYIMVQRDIPSTAMAALLGATENPFMIAGAIIFVLLIAGLFIDRNANILILGGIVIPIFVIELGFSQIHTAMIIVMALGVGHLTPPVGGALLTAALVGKVPVTSIIYSIWPYVLTKLAVTILIIAVPVISEGLPRFFGLGGL